MIFARLSGRAFLSMRFRDEIKMMMTPSSMSPVPIIHLGEERQSEVKFLVLGINATGEAWTQDLQIQSSRC